MDKLNTGYCLVLSGGGAKGVYHIGVWRALKELGIEVDAFIGASIGALIAALLAQGREEELEEIGRTITLDNVLALPEELTENGELKLDRDSLAAARKLFDSLKKNKGLDTSPLRELLTKGLDERKLRESGKDLGLVTVNLSALEPREVYIEDMEEGAIVDYVMASAAFPGFEQTVIAGDKYADGGLYDNIPYAMARRRGYRRIIVSDISGVGRNRKPEIAGSLTVYVRNSVEMGGVLDFNRRVLDDFTRLGYLDTLRVFGRLKGYDYFLEPNDEEEKKAAAAKAPEPSYEFPERMRYDRDLLLKSLECAASILEVERVAAYSYESLTAAIREKRETEDEKLAGIIGSGEDKKASIIAMLREALAQKSLEGSPYYYWRLAEAFLPSAAEGVAKSALVGFYPALPAGLAYLER
jgi:NTE family protein